MTFRPLHTPSLGVMRDVGLGKRPFDRLLGDLAGSESVSCRSPSITQHGQQCLACPITAVVSEGALCGLSRLRSPSTVFTLVRMASTRLIKLPTNWWDQAKRYATHIENRCNYSRFTNHSRIIIIRACTDSIHFTQFYGVFNYIFKVDRKQLVMADPGRLWRTSSSIILGCVISRMTGRFKVVRGDML